MGLEGDMEWEGMEGDGMRANVGVGCDRGRGNGRGHRGRAGLGRGGYMGMTINLALGLES